MILSYITYAIFIGLILWGCRFAGFGNKFHEDFVSLRVTKSVRGLAALGVLLHHISQQAAFDYSGELFVFKDLGRYFVAIFIFCSGYGLVKSYRTKENYLQGFIKNRIVKGLVVPFYLSIAIYAVFSIICKRELSVGQWITGILGLGLINEYSWFPVVLVVLYFAFYFSYKNISSRGKRFAVIGIVIFVMAIIFCIEGHFPWIGAPANWWMIDSEWQNIKWWMTPQYFLFSGEWWVNSNIAFLIGIVFGEYEEKIVEWLKKKYWLKFFMSIVLFALSWVLEQIVLKHFGYWSEFSFKGPMCMDKFITFLGQTPSCIFFIITIFMLMMKFNSSNPVTRFFGKISLDTYMMNFMAINLFYFLINGANGEPITNKGNLALYEICVVAASIALGLCYRFIYKRASIKIAIFRDSQKNRLIK